MRAEGLTVTVELDLSPGGRKAGSHALPTTTDYQPSKPDHHSETGSLPVSTTNYCVGTEPFDATQLIDCGFETKNP